MRRTLVVLVVILLTISMVTHDTLARGFRGGGGRGRGGGGRSFSRGPSMSRARPSARPSYRRPTPRPSVSRPSRPTQRPSVARPSQRPSVGRPTQRPTQRPSTVRPGQRPTTRPGARPGSGSIARPGARPGSGSIARPGARPGSGISRPTARPGRPSRGELQNFLNLPSTPSQRPSNRPNLGQLAGAGAVGAGLGAAIGSQLPDGGPSTRPARPGGGQRPGLGPGDRPGLGDRPGIGDRPGRPGNGDRPGIGDRPGRPGIGDRPGRPGDGNRPGRPDRPGRPGRPNRPIYDINRPIINQNIFNRYTNINTRPFHSGWWRYHRPVNLPYWHCHYHHRGNWWAYATAGALTGWIANAWATPYYYDYGSGGNVYYSENVVYVDGQQYATADEYYDQAAEIATVPEVGQQEADQMEWLSLGVFAVTKEGVNDSNMLLQLAVNKQGLISGTLYNESTDTSRAVQGKVDTETQRAAWMFADGKNTDVVMETGIYNLTEDTSKAIIHFGSERTQPVVLVRLEEPASEQAADGSTET